METIDRVKQYCNSLVQYSRRNTLEVTIGDLPMGGKNPIRIQSMTTADTMDTPGVSGTGHQDGQGRMRIRENHSTQHQGSSKPGGYQKELRHRVTLFR